LQRPRSEADQTWWIGPFVILEGGMVRVVLLPDRHDNRCLPRSFERQRREEMRRLLSGRQRNIAPSPLSVAFPGLFALVRRQMAHLPHDPVAEVIASGAPSQATFIASWNIVPYTVPLTTERPVKKSRSSAKLERHATPVLVSHGKRL
jgi:hypothetical protein